MASYNNLSREILEDKVSAAEALLRHCTLCPRDCGVDRTSGEAGFCKVLDRPKVASWGPHFGEEPPLVGRFGSGTIFLSNCNLGCIFCQNWTLSHEGEGSVVSFDRLAGIMIELQGQGCHNINLVTPTHQIPMTLRSLLIALDLGLGLPIVYNCGGYESLDALRILDGIVDIYMPDIKYADPAIALRYSKVKDYPAAARAALREMHRQVGDLVLDDRGIAVRGLLVRHLVLPENLAGTDEIVRFIAEDISRDTYLNIMDQYYPCHEAHRHLPLDRRITAKEYKAALDLAKQAGLRRVCGVTA